MVNMALTLLPWKSLATTSIRLGSGCNNTVLVNSPAELTSTNTPFTLTTASGSVIPLMGMVLVRTTPSFGRLVIRKKRPAGISPEIPGVGVDSGPGVGLV